MSSKERTDAREPNRYSAMSTTKDLKATSPAVAPVDAEAGGVVSPGWQSPRKPLLRRRRRCLLCCAVAAALLVVLAAALLVVTLTVYRVRPPVMTFNSVAVGPLGLGSNVTVSVDASLENPNAAAVRFGPSTTLLLHGGRTLAVAPFPPGTARARRTMRVNLTVGVPAERLLEDPGLAAELASGSVGVDTSTRVGGRVRVFGVVGHHVDVEMNCTVRFSVADQSILAQSCWSRVWL